MAANILDYLQWRGDLTFRQSPLNEVDGLIFSRLAYLPLEGIVPEAFGEGLTVAEAAERFFAAGEGDPAGRRVLQKEDIPLFRALGESRRFGPLALCGFASQIDYAVQKQFAAVSARLEEDLQFLAFRGTDSTLVGWKEDLNMSFLDAIPAQRDAVAYLERAARELPGRLYLGGHSKGGNLAAYAAAFCAPPVQARIGGVFSNDSPGFVPGILADTRYGRVRARIRAFVPQSSVVGMLLDREEDYVVVHSTQAGLFQHDLYTWEVAGPGFVHLDKVTAGSRFLNRTLKDWVAQLEVAERERFFNALYDIVAATDAKTLPELTEGWVRRAGAAITAYRHTDEATRQLLTQTVAALFQAGRRNLSLLRPAPGSQARHYSD